MAWFIALFHSDRSVSLVSEKWLRKNGKKSYFPKTKVASRIRNEAEVDKKSDQWGLYSCRILMEGTKFQTYSEARNAEAIAQNHSTMASFEASYNEKQKSRKHPKVLNSASESENECEDIKKIAELTKKDSESVATTKKEYAYVGDEASENGDSNASSADEDESDEGDNDSEEVEGQYASEHGYSNASSAEEDQSENDNDSGGDEDQDSENSDHDAENNCGDCANESVNDALDSEKEDNESTGSGENRREHFSNVDCGDYVNETIYDAVEVQESGRNAFENHLESTSELRSPAAVYDFSDDRRLVRVEKLLIHVSRELETLKTDMKALKTTSKDTEAVVEKLVSVCKDLSVEVFSCTEEFKKRNGMFTDLLVPDLKLPVTRRKHYNRNELALEKHKFADNMIKYLASTINESKEKRFIESCFSAVFDIKFLSNKVWWKREPGKVLIKNSKILHCMKESYRMKFGLAEPKKTDKQIERLIYKTSRNLKDKYRKALLKKKNCDESDQECNENKAAKKTTKKAPEERKRTAGNGKRVAEKAKGTAAVNDHVAAYEVRDDAPTTKRSKKRFTKTEDNDCVVDARKAEEAKLVAKEHKRMSGEAKRENKKSKRAAEVDEVESSDDILDDIRISKRGKKRLTKVDNECDYVAVRKVEEMESAAEYKRTASKTKRIVEKARRVVEIDENKPSDEMRNVLPIAKRGKRRLIITGDEDSECDVVVKKRKQKKYV